MNFLTTFPTAVNNIQLTDLKFDSQDRLKCVKQQDHVFGFIPLTSLNKKYSLRDLTHSAVLSQCQSDPLACYKDVRDQKSIIVKNVVFSCLTLLILTTCSVLVRIIGIIYCLHFLNMASLWTLTGKTLSCVLLSLVIIQLGC